MILALQSPPAKVEPTTLALVIAAREFWDAHNDLSPESKALDTALEPFAATVPYANDPTVDAASTD
ncbi:hypothetical protein ACFQ15_05580 [Sphingomonas hankookensis]|uniref:hypothetical protein n=1 Tax=Sphingomonas hankookensis TaxID=563996 RepID=UPI001F56DC16|nr:hypothetical protein [Sphingomonas hankookensis]